MLTGTVNSQGGQAAADTVTFQGTVGAGPYTMNGFTIATSTSSSSSSSTSSNSTNESAIAVTTSVSNNGSSGSATGKSRKNTSASVVPKSSSRVPMTPAQGTFYLDLTLLPVVANVFQIDFGLVEVPAETAPGLGIAPGLGKNFWSDVWGGSLTTPVALPGPVVPANSDVPGAPGAVNAPGGGAAPEVPAATEGPGGVPLPGDAPGEAESQDEGETQP